MSTLSRLSSRSDAGHRRTRPRAWTKKHLRVLLTALIFLAVPVAFEAIWIWVPVVQTVSWSFYQWDGFSAPNWVGAENYLRLFDDPVFHTALLNNGIWIVGMTLVPILIGLPLAVVLNGRLRGSRVFASIFFLPIVLSFVVIGLMWSWMYQPDGLLNAVLAQFGIDQPVQWLASDATALPSVLLASMWRHAGYVMLIYLAGLKTVDPALLDAARVDGASPWQSFWHVTVPSLAPVHVIVVVITIIDSLRAFDLTWVMTKGGPYNSSDVIATQMYRESVFNFNVGYGSAIATTLFALSLVFVITYLVRVLRKA